MITNFSDHAANERTFLAWVRTSIAVIAFGFLVERFDLFLVFASITTGRTGLPAARSGFGQVAGLVLIVLGMAMIAIAAVRFWRTAKEIDDTRTHPGTGSRVDLALAALLFFLAGGLVFYLVHTLAAKA
jgi:putative membrane protein